MSPYLSRVPIRGSSGEVARVDTMAVTGDDDNRDEPGDLPRDPESRPVSKVTLRRVEGPIDPADGPPPVQLLREYKGLTVADLVRDEIVDRLPGQVRTALNHIRNGDFEAAERALPGDFSPVLRGPGFERRRSHRFLLWLLVTAALLAATLASYWF